MTGAKRKILKKYTGLITLLAVSVSILYGLSYLNKKFGKEYVIAAAENVCRSYPGFRDKAVSVMGIADTKPAADPYRTVLHASIAGKEAFIFFIPLTGKYGIYPAVFCYEQSTGCTFCGLAGVENDGKSAEYYGITQISVILHQQKIEKIMNRQVRHEK